jgi:gamma-glutamyltranspeptidase/glutathione hydrolase
MREHGGEIPNGVRRTVVPAAPDAWITALERHGTMGFADVAEFAIRYARDADQVRADPASGLVTAGADPRRPAYAIAG